MAGLATHLGQQLPAPGDDDRPWKATLRGGIALELTYLLPIAGWFGILPISWIYGAGAANLAYLDRRRARRAQTRAAAAPHALVEEPVAVLTAAGAPTAEAPTAPVTGTPAAQGVQ